MKTFLALYICAEDSQNHEAWKQLAPEAQKERMQVGMAARERWLEKYKEQIVSQGSSLGEKTKLVDNHGVHDLPRQMGAFIVVRAAPSGKNVVIEVEDECGGLNSDAIKNLFKPFVSGGFDQTGLGLGLTIVQRAVTMLQGKISHQNNPGRGCGFRIEVPKVLVPVPANRAVEGLSSAHPKPSRS